MNNDGDLEWSIVERDHHKPAGSRGPACAPCRARVPNTPLTTAAVGLLSRRRKTATHRTRSQGWPFAVQVGALVGVVLMRRDDRLRR